MNELVIDLRGVNSKQELHNLLSTKLGFPKWYGNNWDAFWDVINNSELVNMPDRLFILGFKELSETLPKDAEVFQRCLLDLKKENPSISCDVIFS